MQKLFFIALSLFLTSCAQQTMFVKAPHSIENLQIDKVMLVVDYVELVDDFGEFYDFDEDRNLQKNDELFDSLSEKMNTKGYQMANESLQSSGLYLYQNLLVEHYANKKLQADLISPPFYTESRGLEDNDLQLLGELMQDLLVSLDPVIVDRGEKSQRYLNSLEFSEFTKGLNVSENSAILLVLVSKERISAIKGLGLTLLSAAASQNSRVNVGFYGNYGNGFTHAYLIDAQSGKLVWTNYTNKAISAKSLDSLLRGFPAR